MKRPDVPAVTVVLGQPADHYVRNVVRFALFVIVVPLVVLVIAQLVYVR